MADEADVGSDLATREYSRRSVITAMALGAALGGGTGFGLAAALDVGDDADGGDASSDGAGGSSAGLKINRTPVEPLARSQHSTAVLAGGLVLCIGGVSPSGTLASCQVYDPEKNEWYDAAPLARPRSFHSSTPLGDGRVLVLGGLDGEALSVASVFDPKTDEWTRTKPLETPRYNHAATPLPDGRVVLTGGFNVGPLAGAEIYDPS